MNWSDQLTRIRRWIRDPDANVFSEAFLLRLFNDEADQFYALLGVSHDVQVVRVPPEFQGTYIHDWEYTHSGYESGEVFQAGEFYDAGEYTYTYVWEPESIKGYNATSTEKGDVYTHPWEAWAVGTPYMSPPIPLPSNFESMLFAAFDRDPIDPESKREIMRSDDTTWKTWAGTPLSYWRDSKNENWIRLYPKPSISWQDTAEDVGEPDQAEYATSEAVDVDNNLVVVFQTRPAEIEADDDELEIPSYLQKYIEYGTAARALRANTDGRIESLADYWELRKKAGYEAVKKLKRLRLTDRNLQLRTRTTSGIGQRPKYPRLPSTYPDGWA